MFNLWSNRLKHLFTGKVYMKYQLLKELPYLPAGTILVYNNHFKNYVAEGLEFEAHDVFSEEEMKTRPDWFALVDSTPESAPMQPVWADPTQPEVPVQVTVESVEDLPEIDVPRGNISTHGDYRIKSDLQEIEDIIVPHDWFEYRSGDTEKRRMQFSLVDKVNELIHRVNTLSNQGKQ